MKRLVKLGLVLALALGAAVHLVYWYWPRERAGAPEPAGYGARLLASGAYGACLWLPYPHQNLGSLSAALGDGSAYLAAISRAAGTSTPSLRAFGPFTVPPSREISRSAGRPRLPLVGLASHEASFVIGVCCHRTASTSFSRVFHEVPGVALTVK